MAAVENKEIVQIAACRWQISTLWLNCLTDLATLSFYMANTPWLIYWYLPSICGYYTLDPLCWLPLSLVSTMLLEDAVSYAPLPENVSLVANSQPSLNPKCLDSYHQKESHLSYFWQGWIRLCRSLPTKVWLCMQTHDRQSLCLRFCFIECRSSSYQTCHWFDNGRFHCFPQKIYISTWLSIVNLERQWNKFRWRCWRNQATI